MTNLQPKLAKVLDRILKKSQTLRAAYENRMEKAHTDGKHRTALSCGNLAHGFAACGNKDKKALKQDAYNLAIVSAYNEMLSAHEPFKRFPDIIKEAANARGAVAQFAGGVPAMCDGVTQGQPGMELSLFSRDNIAMATAVALSHNMFDATVCLGVCDKIVPGMVIGTLSFGHLPTIFMPAGPMPSGLPNKEKARIREDFAQGKIGRDALLEAESKAYHSPGTCTFYGTANTNQMLMEFMGLHLPGASFINPGNEMRDFLTKSATEQLITNRKDFAKERALYKILSPEAFVNGIVGLLATGGSTNLTIHLIAMARAAGVVIDWTDMSELSEIVPLLARVYPNGSADVNHFHAAGGLGFIIGELLSAGLLIEDVQTVVGHGLSNYTKEPQLAGQKLSWVDGTKHSLDQEIVRPVSEAFSKDGGLKLLSGNLGRSVIKVSAVAPEHRVISAKAAVFEDQNDVLAAYNKGELHRDVVIVLRNQGPKANGMPELHKLTPALGVLQSLGHKVALVTDGRMSGASGRIPAAIHLSPEALCGGAIGSICDGDEITLDSTAGTLNFKSTSESGAKTAAASQNPESTYGMGRELFAVFRSQVGSAEEGASVLFAEEAAYE